MSMKISSNGSRVFRRTLGTHSFVYSIMPTQGMMIETSSGRGATEILLTFVAIVGSFAQACFSPAGCGGSVSSFFFA